MLDYARAENIPIFSDDSNDICDKLGIHGIQNLEPYSYDKKEDKKWLKRIMDSNKFFSEKIADLKDGDFVVVGGAHIWTSKGRGLHQRLEHYLDDRLYFEGCVRYPIVLMDRIKKYYNKDLWILIDPRISLEAMSTLRIIDNSKLYEVIGKTKIVGDMVMKPLNNRTS
jgi:hypothetical protein